MALGMTYQEYWYGEVTEARAFLEAEKIRQKQRREMTNATAHLFGAYFYESLIDVAPVLHTFAKKGTKPRQYRKEPFPFDDDEKQPESEERHERREQNEALMAEVYMRNMVRAGQNWGKR